MKPARFCPVIALAVAAPFVTACSSAPGEATTGVDTQGIACAATGCGGGGGGGGPTAAACKQVAVGCTVTADPNGWADAKADTFRSDAATVYPWLDALQAAGCTTPSVYTWRAGNAGLWLSTCPDSVSSIPVPAAVDRDESFDDLVLVCDWCVGLAPSGQVHIAWNASGNSPSGCKGGSCASWNP